MLVLCYGMQKSGSTLAFELVRGMLISAGFEQPFIRNDIRADGTDARNFVGPLDRGKIETLLEIIGPARRIAVKTHAPLPAVLFAWMEELLAKRAVQVVASFRDPRDICLSLLDAGKASRRMGRKDFAKIVDLDDAVAYTAQRIKAFRTWAALRGSLRLDYETVAFAPDEAIRAIETALGIACDPSAAKRHAFETARTLKNRAVRNRHCMELADDQSAALALTFGEFIEQACQKNSQAWYDSHRARLLARGRNSSWEASDEPV